MKSLLSNSLQNKFKKIDVSSNNNRQETNQIEAEERLDL